MAPKLSTRTVVKPHLAHSDACAASAAAESLVAGATPSAPTQVPHCAAQDALAVMAGSGAVSATVLASGGPADSVPALLWPRYSYARRQWWVYRDLQPQC